MDLDSDTLRKLCYEDERLGTFENWPLNFIKKEALAKTGFYYTGVNDHVICIFCGIEIGLWEEGDDPETEHRSNNPNCGLLLATDAAAVNRRNDNVIGLAPKRDYTSIDARFYSFREWPISLKQTPKQMAQAGFYYTGKGDKVICFTCGIGLNKWLEGDDPWTEHATWNANCAYVVQEKGEDFITAVREEIIRKEEEEKAIQVKALSAINDQESINEQLLCTVCKNQTRRIVSLPCRHLATCKECNRKLTNCPVCKTEEKENLEIFIP